MIRLAAIEPAAAAPPPLRSSSAEQARVLHYRPRTPVPAGRYRLEIAYPAAGLVDHLVELRSADGARQMLRLAVTRRNHFDGMIELAAPLAVLLLHVSGSGVLARPPRLRLNRWPDHQRLRRQAGRLWRMVLRERLGVALWLAAALSRRWRRPGAPDAAWRALFDERPERDARLHRARLARLTRRPVFAVIASPGDEHRLAHALRAQLYPGWRVFSAAQAPAALAEADFVLVHRPGLRLRAHALLEYASAAALFPHAWLLYGDHESGGRREFKPAWSPTLLAHRDYLGDAACFSTRLPDAAALLTTPGGAGRRLRTLAAELPAERVVHVPRILSGQDQAEAGEPGTAPGPGAPQSVSLIIPTRDRAALLARCVERCLATTAGRAVEFVIIDNGSTEPDALRLLDQYRRHKAITVLRQPGPFNYSALCNAGAAAAHGAVLVFLNNDVEPLAEGWLDQLMELAARPGIGCVGALLLYPDGTVQHAGVVLGIHDRTAHRLRGARPDDPALGDPLGGPRELMAVTGACLAVRAVLFHAAGGFDAAALAVSYNDVDLCLKVAALGHRTLWAPGVRLLHHESATRGRDASPAQHDLTRREYAVMLERWGVRLLTDPYYSPNLSHRSEDMAIRSS